MKQVKATVIAHSMSSVSAKEIVTFELEFPRIVLAEFNTHNALSKNASSSRAIPVATMLKQVRENPAFPVRFGAANTGMQDKGEHSQRIIFGGGDSFTAEDFWKYAGYQAALFSEAFHEAGYAKQICNRLIEPFQMMKVVMTATDLENFFWLRDHYMADPTIAALAFEIKKAYKNSRPTVLQPGEWHLPYVERSWHTGEITYHLKDEYGLVEIDKVFTLQEALMISSSCCAQVSYRKLDDTYEKAQGVVARLNLQGEEPDEPVHASPLEHQATPIQRHTVDYSGLSNTINGIYPETWEEGITHLGRDGQFGSGNLWGFIQHRQLVPNHVKRG